MKQILTLKYCEPFVNNFYSMSLVVGWVGIDTHGVVGIVLPNMVENIYKEPYRCPSCHQVITHVALNDDTVIWEFWQNYHLVLENDYCDHYNDDGRCCILYTLDYF